MMPRTIVLLVIFFLSGVTGLIYEVLWTRQLSLIFGVTTYAVSAVLATFMGGLALGSYLMGRGVDRVRRPLLVYALLELGIGLYALLVPILLDALRPLLITLTHLGLPYALFSLVRALMAAAVLLLPTTLMGGTYTVLVKHWVYERRNLAQGAGVLYLTNTAGALFGCGLAGYFLIEHLGLSGTNRLAAAANVVLAAAAALLARRVVTQGSAAPEEDTVDLRPALSRSTANLVLFTAGLSGFVSLAAEVLWTRALLRYLYNSTYAFTTMLTTFLMGIAIGSALFSALLSRRRSLLVFAILQAGVACGLVFALSLFAGLDNLGARVFGSNLVSSFERSLTIMFLRSAIILLPSAIFLGAMFPMAATLYASGRSDVGRAIGRVYAVNTLGAIAGSLGCAFVLIPVLGMWGTHTLLVMLSLAGAGAVAMAATSGLPQRIGVVAAVAAVMAIASVTAPADIFRSTFLPNKDQHLAYYEEGATDTVGVQEGWGQRSIVYEDQRGTAATTSFGVNLFLGHLPMLLHPGTPRRVLHICFGVGNSLSAVAAHPELERVDNVELSPHVLGAGPLFWSNDGVLEHPKVRTIIDDGRNFLMTSPEMYDVILLEPPETFTAGVINLYTTEFYRDALAHLAPDGVLMQWIPTANAPLDDERRLFRAFSDVLPHATMWWQLNGGCALLIGTRETLKIDYQRLKARMAEPRIAQDMALSQVADADHLLSFFRFDDAAFKEFVRDAQPTTDDFTVLDFSMPRYVGSGFGLGQFSKLARAGDQSPYVSVNQRKREYEAMQRSVVPYLVNLGDDTPEAITRRIEDRRKIAIKNQWIKEADWKELRKDGRLQIFPAATGVAKAP